MSCPDCFRGAVHDHDKFTGKFAILHGLKCYITPPPTSEPTTLSPSTLIYLTDAFGLNLINTLLLADHFARELNCRVLVPDVIPLGGGNGPAILEFTQSLGPAPQGVVGWVKWLGRAVVSRPVMLVKYLAFMVRIGVYSTPQRGYRENILPFVTAVRCDLPKGGKLGVVGFCWGGWSSIKICTEPLELNGRAVEGRSLVDVQFCGHPYAIETPMIVDAVTRYRVPVSVAVGDRDQFLKREKIDEMEAALRSLEGTAAGMGTNYEIEVYPGCTHGFVVRAAPDNAVETEAAERARAQGVSWLRQYL
jgi:dienelactone hydrolase